MKWLITINDRRDLKPSLTTYALMQGAAKRGHQIFVCDISDFVSTAESQIRVEAFEIAPTLLGSAQAVADWVVSDGAETLAVTDFDVWLLRTNPARDLARTLVHQTVMDLAIIAKEQGVQVLNNPETLRYAASTLYLRRFPSEIVPETFVSNRSDLIIKHLKEFARPVVIKPLQGTRGSDVFRVASADDPNVHQIIDVVVRNGYALVQEFIEDARGGDLRVLLIGGQILEAGGKECAIRRIPKSGDFRGNLHAGGQLEATTLSSEERQILEIVGPALAEDGLFFAAVDCLGGKLLEVNIFSPGAWDNAERAYGVDFNGAVLEAIEAEVELFKLARAERLN